MKNRHFLGLLCVAFLSAISFQAHAEENISKIAGSGDWATYQHSATLISAPDLCWTSYTSHKSSNKLLFRADIKSIEIRIGDSKWSLPKDISGSIKIDIDNISHNYKVGANNVNYIIVYLSRNEIEGILKEMDTATSMSITVGGSKPQLIVLAGSAKATNAFRTCAKFRGNVGSEDSNPFVQPEKSNGDNIQDSLSQGFGPRVTPNVPARRATTRPATTSQTAD